MTDLRQAAQQALEALEAITRSVQSDHQAEIAEDAITALRAALAMYQVSEFAQAQEQQAETPPEWPLVKNILAEYGLDAIAFVAEFKAAQRPWVGLTEFQFAEIYNKWNDTNGSTPWGLNQALEAKLKERNK